MRGYAEEGSNTTPQQYPSHDQMRVKLPPTQHEEMLLNRSSAKPCANKSCGFYGTTDFDFLCSKCYIEARKQKKEMMEDGNVTPSERSKNEEIIIPPNSALPDFQPQQPMSNKVLAAQGR